MLGVIMKQTEYKTLLLNTHYWSNLPPEEQGIGLNKLSEYIKQTTPKQLFRFRDCSERSFDAFYKDQIWTSSADVMNDDFDARMFFRLEELENWIKTQNGVQIFKELLTIHNKTGEPPSHVKEIIPDIESLFQLAKHIPTESFESMEQKLKTIFLDGCDSYRDDLIRSIQQRTRFACFSKNVRSPLMWGHYADSAAGFALAYNFKDSPLFDDDGYFSKQYGCELYPVLYTSQRFDATDYAKNFWIHHIIQVGLQLNGISFDSNHLWRVLPPVDLFSNKKIALHKSKDWAPEKEWRLFINPYNLTDANCRHLPLPKRPCAIYLGRKISSINEKILTGIASEKKLPVFKMDVVNDKEGYKLHPKKIQ